MKCQIPFLICNKTIQTYLALRDLSNEEIT